MSKIPTTKRKTWFRGWVLICPEVAAVIALLLPVPYIFGRLRELIRDRA
jgi:hypothetical protein